MAFSETMTLISIFDEMVRNEKILQDQNQDLYMLIKTQYCYGQTPYRLFSRIIVDNCVHTDLKKTKQFLYSLF